MRNKVTCYCIVLFYVGIIYCVYNIVFRNYDRLSYGISQQLPERMRMIYSDVKETYNHTTPSINSTLGGLFKDTGDCDIRFAEQKLPVVALASPPGAGSTWVRHLLQQATGIYTGSVYHDEVLFKAGFLGEMEDPYAGKVIITKIHKPIKIWHFSSVILLIRNIYDASLSEFNRRKTGLNHTAITDLTSMFS
ncbi:sialate:O-sulfotransferase 1-like [Saccoglossus kowalevskii]